MPRKKIFLLLLASTWLSTTSYGEEKDKKTGINIPQIIIVSAIGQVGAIIAVETWSCLKKTLSEQPASNKNETHAQFNKCTSLLNAALKAKQNKKESCYQITIEKYRKEFEKLPSLEPKNFGGLLDHVEKLKLINKSIAEWQKVNYKKFVVEENPIRYQEFLANQEKKRTESLETNETEENPETSLKEIIAQKTS